MKFIKLNYIQNIERTVRFVTFRIKFPSISILFSILDRVQLQPKEKKNIFISNASFCTRISRVQVRNSKFEGRKIRKERRDIRLKTRIFSLGTSLS